MFLVVKVLVFSLCSSLFCKWCMFIFSKIFVFCFLILGVLGPWEFLWRVGSYMFPVCVTPLCEVPGRDNFYLGTVLERMAGLYRFFLFLWFCCSGYGTVEMVRGGGPYFFLLSSVCCQFSWRSDVCGRTLCSINRFSLVDLRYFIAVPYLISR